MFEILKSINENYAALLSLFASVIMIVVTIIYVRHTKRQADYAEKSVETLINQIKVEKQPCIVPVVTNSYGSAFLARDYVRKQLSFEINLHNCGDAAAVNVYTIASFELQINKDKAGNKPILFASLLPSNVHAIMREETKTVSIHFETYEIESLLEELEEAMSLNWERVKKDPTRHHYEGAKLVIITYYRNVMGQWYKSSIKQELPWLEYMNPPKKKTHNINETTIPPCKINEGDEFKAVLTTEKYSPFVFEMVSEEEAVKSIKKFEDESPWIKELIL